MLDMLGKSFLGGVQLVSPTNWGCASVCVCAFVDKQNFVFIPFNAGNGECSRCSAVRVLPSKFLKLLIVYVTVNCLLLSRGI